jgi:hypothetical protein
MLGRRLGGGLLGLVMREGVYLLPHRPHIRTCMRHTIDGQRYSLYNAMYQVRKHVYPHSLYGTGRAANFTNHHVPGYLSYSVTVMQRSLEGQLDKYH